MTDDIKEEFLSLKAGYMRLFSTDDGKAVLKDLAFQARYDEPLSLDSNEMQRQEGARILFLRIKELALDPMPTSDNQQGELA